MPVQALLQDEGEFQVALVADTPSDVLLRAASIKNYAHASVVITPQHFRVGDISDADLRAMARWSGLYYAQTDQLLNLEGPGLIRALGTDSVGGDMYAGVDTTSASLDLEDQLDARIFTSFANGLTKGTVNAAATARTIKIPGAQTRRVIFDTILAAYVSGGYEFRVNPDGSVDVNTAANLYATTPTVALTREGGRDGNITGLAADLDLSTVDVEDWRSDVEVRWNETTPGTNNGVASNSPPSTWKNLAGAAPEEHEVIDWQPRRQFRERPNRSDRYNGSRYGVWAVNAQAQATNLAVSHANQSASYALEVTADVDEYDPWRFLDTGHYVWVYDQQLGLVDTANEVYYRGSAIHPLKLRVQAMTTPIQEGYGVYLRYWDGAAFALLDLTPYVEWEDDLTTIELGTRSRFHPRNARPRRFNRRRVRRMHARNYRIQQYLAAVG